MRSLARPLALLVGLGVGALVVAFLPAAWLFRDPPLERPQDAASDGRTFACPMFCTMDDAPGPCPVCGMDMEPVVDHGDKVPLRKRDRMMLGLRTVLVRRGPVIHTIRAYGKIRRDERTEAQVTAWVGGRLDRLYLDYTGTEVRVGDHVAEIYAPELIAAQEELISALRALDRMKDEDGPGFASLRQSMEAGVKAAHRKLVLLGMPTSVVDAVAEDRTVRDHLTVFATVGGTVVTKHVDRGDYVQTGTPMFTVVNLDEVWVMLEVFEEDAGAVRIGQKVVVDVPSLPGPSFEGTIAFIDPLLDESLRVAKVRVNLSNAQRLLRPGTFVNAEIEVELTSRGGVHDPVAPGTWYCPMHTHEMGEEPGTCSICGMDLVQKMGDPSKATQPGAVLVVPAEAVLSGGTRKLVYVETQEPGPEKDGEDQWPGLYEPRWIRTGFRVGEEVIVLSGVSAGDRVVTRGQFLIDSQLQLTGRPSLLVPQGSRPAPADPHAGH